MGNVLISRKLILAALAFAVLLVASSSHVMAQTAADVCLGVAAAGATCSEGSTGTTVNTVVGLVVNILSVLVGIAAVIMIIIGGFKYVTSAGDSSNVKSAKDTIIYAIIGLVVVAMAQMITGFVLDRVT